MRGDNVVVVGQHECVTGSPPHAWGQLHLFDDVFDLAWFTPTCVGTIFSPRPPCPPAPVHPHMRGDNGPPVPRSPVRTVHPHMRGDNHNRPVQICCHSGSPPHAWGQCLVCLLNTGEFRFTPTCVGTIYGLGLLAMPVSVHPHMRGDNVDCAVVIAHKVRFTPTCVGTIIPRLALPIVRPVHPHMRGDNLTLLPIPRPGAGSPPHAWGQYDLFHRHRFRVRFTPTCVGTMVRLLLLLVLSAVHPHMRGDNYGRRSRFHTTDGSPPHAWGQWSWRRQRRSSRPVHPHMRGDNRSRAERERIKDGSPPHAWGQ